MRPTKRNLVGRDEELAVLVEALDTREELPGATVLCGEAGIGKTSLWLAGIDAAATMGYRVVSARPSEAESGFSFSGLGDLLREDAESVVPHLPPIQRRALETALLLGDSGVQVDDRGVAAAFLAAVCRLAADGPLCVAVDDMQWLDAESLGAVRYAFARLDGEPIAGLFAIRGVVPDWLRRAVPEDRLRTIDVVGLSLGATHELLRARLDVKFSRPTLIRLWETSRGNPFFALELAAALQRRGGALAPGEELPIPSDLDELLHARFTPLGAPALEVASAVAALADPTLALVEAALGARFDQGLAEALEARILELDGPRLRFTHPLLGSAVVARQTPARRRSLNARLAEVVPTTEERARHLALGTAEPDEDIASTLEQAANEAQARGAPAAAAQLAEQALRLTLASRRDDARRRVLLAANMHNRAGDIARATALLEQARAAAAPGNGRATVLARLAGVQTTARDATALYREALAEAGGDDALQADIHLNLAALMRFSDGVGSGLDHGELAVLAASRVDDAALLCRALAAHGLLHFNAGRGIPATMEEALTIERSLPGWPIDDGPTGVFGHQLWWSGDVERARALFQDLRSAVKTRNAPAQEADALWYLSLLEWRAGNWEEADRHAAESLDITKQIGRRMPPDEFPSAIIAAHRGRIDEARDLAQGAVDRAETDRIGVALSGYTWVLAFVELSLGDAAAALAHLRRAGTVRDQMGVREPGMRLELGDLLEALIAVGELDEADAVLVTWQEHAEGLDRPWALAILARCRALLLAARGDLDGAFASFDDALAEHARSTDPFHRARTLLALGRTQRRAKRRGAARTTLQDALAAFERLGAPLWIEQAGDELGRIGGRSPSRGDLTEAESRIARLVAQGRTNREVADSLFLTVHSVETALTRIYRKLDVRSRAELASQYAAKT